MFGSSVRLRDGVALVSRSSEFEDEVELGASCGALLRGLDQLGVGEWITEQTGGGCHVFALYLENGSGDYVWVSDARKPLSWACSADDFGSGGVRVGFYPAEESFDDECYNYEGVLFVEGFASGVDRETAIVEAVARVFAAVGFDSSEDRVDWARVAGAVLAGVCERCDGTGEVWWRGDGLPAQCSGCRYIAEASEWVRPSV